MRWGVAAGVVLCATVGVNLPSVLPAPQRPPVLRSGAATAPVPAPSAAASADTSVPSTSPPGTSLPIASPTPRPTARPRLAPRGPATLVTRVETDDPVVFITIDDGLVRDPRLARFLARRGIPVTTFLTTSAATPGSRPFWMTMLGLGSVQNHTVDHPTLRGMGVPGAAREICAANEDIAELTGTTPWMLRPPYGRVDGSTLAAAGECGLDYVVMWSVSLPARYLRYQAGDRVRAGDIILTHYRTDLLPHLRRALREITAAGLRVARLEDYLRPRGS